MRLFPHDSDTGGFFVCVLEKKAAASSSVPAPPPVKETPVLEAVTVADETGSTTLKRELSPSAETGPEEAKKSKKEVKREEKKQRRDPNWKEDPFSYVDQEHDEVKSIV